MLTILLPTDFSENSKNAIRYALDFFSEATCTFYFLNVQKSSEFIMDDFYTADPNKDIYTTLLEDNKNKLQKFVEEFEKTYSHENFTFKQKVDYDGLTASIKQILEDTPIDVLVMGSNGATGAQEVVFGSNTLQVMREIDCPLLIVPEGYVYKPIASVLFTLHHNENLELHKMSMLFSLLTFKKAKLEVLDVHDDPFFSPQTQEPESIKKAFEDFSYHFHQVSGITAPVATDAFIQLFDVGMHAIFSTKESFFERFLFGSENKQLGYRTRIPLLMLSHSD